MIKTAEKFLKKYNIENQNVIIGFSAGPDSCALALVINGLKDKFNLKITLAYFNHGWRINEAREEEEFTENFAKMLGCDYVTAKAPKNLKKTEEYAREARYDFFEKTAKKLNSRVVLLAHNKNDNIETLIYRIVKGTSISGLASIPAHRDIYYRPFLTIEKSEILKFLKDNNQDFKFDSSNNDEKYRRNLIRNKILPIFSEINPNYLNNIQNLIDNAEATRKIVNNFIKKIECGIIKNGKISRKEYIELEKEVRLEILNNYLINRLKYRTKANLEKFDDFILKNSNSKTSLNRDEFLVIKNNRIYLEKKEVKLTTKIEINDEGIYEFENFKFEIKKVKAPSVFPKDNKDFCYLNFDFPITVRHRISGDRFSPYGLKGTMKLKEYLINQKMEQSQKDKLALFCKGNEVCWIAGLKISEKFKVISKECYQIKLIQKEN